MNLDSVSSALAALSNGSRLAVFRLLLKSGKQGMSAGAIARETGLVPQTLSGYLTILVHSKLVTSRRDGRSIIYAVNIHWMVDMIGFLVEDCVVEHPQICQSLFESLSSIGAIPPAPAPETAKPLQGRRALIVEDQFIIAMSLHDMLLELGALAVCQAANLDEAIGLAREAAVDMAVIDVWLGKDKSYEVWDILAGRGIPFVVTSMFAARDEPDRYRVIPRVLKPFSRDDLLSALHLAPAA